MQDKIEVYLTNADLVVWACKCFETAEKEGFRLPEYINPQVEYLLETRNLWNMVGLGCRPHLLSFIGNKSRIGSKLCKFIVLDFLAFLLKHVQNRKNLPDINTLLDPDTEEIILGSYGAYAANPNRLQTGPRLLPKGKNKLTVENKISYPNTSNIKANRNSPMMLKLFNMRYVLNPHNQTASLKPLPAFRYDPRSQTVQPKSKDLSGHIASLTYCEQAQYIKSVIVACVSVLIGDGETEETRRLQGKVIDFAQIIAGLPIEFFRSSEQPSLFPSMLPPLRSNGDLDFYSLEETEQQELIDQIDLVYGENYIGDDRAYFDVDLKGETIGRIFLTKEDSFNDLCEAKVRHLEAEGCFAEERWYVRSVELAEPFRGFGIGKLIYYLAFEDLSDIRQKHLLIASEDCNVPSEVSQERHISKQARGVWRSILKDEFLPSRYGVVFVCYDPK